MTNSGRLGRLMRQLFRQEARADTKLDSAGRNKGHPGPDTISHNVYYVIDSHGCIIKLDALCRCLLSQGSRRWLFNFNRSACF